MALLPQMALTHSSEARRPGREAGPKASADRREGNDGSPPGARRRDRWARGLDAQHESAAGQHPMAGDARVSRWLYDDGMPEKDPAHSEDPLDQMLDRSDALMERLTELLDDAEFDGSPRGEVALGMCVVAMEHATALRALMALGLPTSAVSLMRLQFEALTRALDQAEAGAVRMRPIVITTVSSLVAMIPIALGIGAGSELMQPLAIATVGGLALSSILTLVVVPCGYLVLHGAGDKLKTWLVGKRTSTAHGAEPDVEVTAGD